LTGDQTLVEQTDEIKRKHPRSSIPTFSKETDGKEWVKFEKLYQERTCKVELCHTAWENFDRMSVRWRNGKHEFSGLVVDLVLADPWYGAKFQPTKTEQVQLRKLFDSISKDYTVFIIFGRHELLHNHWTPVFEKHLAGSGVDYKIESSMFHVDRSPLRDKHTNNLSTWHSMCETALTVIRIPKPSGKGGKNTGESKAAPPKIFRFTPEFAKKYGKNGQPSNVYKDYEPPSARMRLRDGNGKELRNNAEKSTLLNEYLVDLFTPKQGTVFDLFAGTASMGVACIKTNRSYVGCEIDQDVHRWATQRLGRTWFVYDRGDLLAAEGGLRRTLAEQVLHSTKTYSYH
jgi:16S rRNA G966 N2-methylase RsmD